MRSYLSTTVQQDTTTYLFEIPSVALFNPGILGCLHFFSADTHMARR